VLLRPAILDDLGVGPALQWLVEDFTRRTGILCELEEQWSNGDALPQAVRTCVYRVLQEALHNCEKHAQATRVRVQGKETRGSLEVIVEDNGRGFDIGAIANDQPHTRFGLLGMRERAAALGGEVRFESAPGRGTRLTLTVPVPSTADASKSAAGVQIGAG
jgi:signal transduction histidine kinase